MELELKGLLEKWHKRLQRFEEHPEVAKGMDDRTAMGIQHGRTVALKECIQELEVLLVPSES